MENWHLRICTTSYKDLLNSIYLRRFECQAKAKRNGFKVEDINTVANVRATPNDVHKEISAFYSSKQPYTNGKTVRDWLNGQSYEAQYKFGIEQWEKFMKQHRYSI